MMKEIFVYMLLLLSIESYGQVTLEKVLSDIAQQAPETQLINLSREATLFQQKNISSARKPQLSFNAQSTYQSDVTAVNVELPGIDIPTVNEFQYKFQGEVSQLILDGGKINANKNASYIKGQIEQTKTDIQLDQVKSKAIELFFNILESERVIQVLEFKNEALEARRVILQAGVDSGVALESEIFILDAAILEIEQEIARIFNIRSNGVQALSIISGVNYSADSEYLAPEVESEIVHSEVLKYHQLLKFQSESIDINQDIRNSESKPHLVAFAQLGMGNPGLNFLEEGLTDYYIIGMKLNWKLGGLYTKSNDQQLNKIFKDQIVAQKNIFDRDWKSTESQFRSEINMHQELTEINESLVQLRSSITGVASTQLDNGVINSAEYISRLNEEYAARVNLDLARIRKLKAQFQLIQLYNLLP